MYERYWDLTCRPFEGHFSPAFHFSGGTHEAAQLKLRYLIENGLSACLLCGGIGTGKTELAALLQHELGESIGPFVHLGFPQMTPRELLAYLAAKLGIDDAALAGREIDLTLRHIERVMEELSKHACRPTIVIDDAHLIGDVHVFECLQLLLNIQPAGKCPFSLLLVGAPALLGRLERMPQLNDRIAIRSVLEPLSREETVRYVVHRLLAAGASREIFDRGALDALCDRSGGIPRRISHLADLALLVGYADGLRTIGAAEIAAAAEELPDAIAA